MTVERDQIIEVGARAVFDVAGTRSYPFDKIDPEDQAAWREEATAAYDAMVTLIRQQTERQVDEWVNAYAYSPDDIVLGPFTRLDNDGYAALHKLLDIVRPGWREALQRQHDEAQARAAAIAREVGARPLDQEGPKL